MANGQPTSCPFCYIYSVINVLPSKWLQLNAGGVPNARPAQ